MIARAPASDTRHLILSSRLGLVSVPDAGMTAPFSDQGGPDGKGPAFDREAVRELLRGLGASLGMTLLAAPADEFPEAGEERPAFPDAAVRKTLQAMDAVWMDGDEVVAAFVAEEGVSRGEGLRKLADLLALHPKLKAALYVVSLPSLKAGLLAEMNRPLYRLLKKPMGQAMRILDWKRLESEVKELGERVRYLKAEFLEGISEVVEPPAEA